MVSFTIDSAVDLPLGALPHESPSIEGIMSNALF